MQTLAEKFFTTEEQQQITRTVRQVEQQTAGEIVPMVVSASHSYPEAELTGAMVMAGPLALGAAFGLASLLWWQGEVLWLFLGCFPVFFFLARLMLRHCPPLLRFFLLRERIEGEVARAAFTHFYAEGLQATKDATGVLIYISVLERKVWILGDRGINAQLSPQIWQDYVDRLTVGVRKKRPCEALCAIIEEIGALLQTHFPHQADDRNELGDLMIVGPEANTGGRGLRVK
ncbi:MAG: TPM domain-containing protein [Desulfobulbaceae bacterium]|nr:TPM domain-containing protein [Desulfobulbaceae bacterium]